MPNSSRPPEDGTPLPSPVTLGDAATALRVEGGNADVFMVLAGGEREGARQPVARMPSGALVPPVPQVELPAGTQLVVVAGPGVSLRAVDWQALLRTADAEELATALVPWYERFGRQHTTAPAEDLAPLDAQALRALLESGDPAAALRAATAERAARIRADLLAQEQAERERLAAKERDEAVAVERALRQLAGVHGAGGGAQALPADPLLAACTLVGRRLDIAFEPHPDNQSEAYARDPVTHIARASRVRARQVALKGRWWEGDQGPLLVFVEDGKLPRAALPRPSGGYLLEDPVSGRAVRIDEDVAATLEPFGTQFYRSFPARALALLDVMRFGAHGSTRDLWLVVAMGAAGALLNLVPALATGVLFDTVIPGADRSQLLQLCLALVGAAVGAAMFELTRSVAMLRVEARMDTGIQAGVWDRLLALPVPFFRDYTAGDLAVRANGINAIRQALSGTTTSAILGAVFSVFNLALLMFYSPLLAGVALLLVLLALGVTAGTSLAKLRYERQLADLEGRLSGLVLQLLNAVAKLRATGSEARAFAQWASRFAQHRTLKLKAERIGNILETFNAAFPLACSIVIFMVVAFYLRGGSLSTGEFLAFNAAFGALLLAMLQMTAALVVVLTVVPLFERARPILHALPETDGVKADPGRLRGDIEVSHLNFSYGGDAPPVLRDVSLRIRAGQFVAIVGPSGSGKSTLLRCLLGFETPTSGSIFYDGQDLSVIDITAVRRQLGVVLQNGQLLPGDIFKNIVGSSGLGIEDAWQAARMAGLEPDIKAMPMGMHTIVGASGISGGQRQRLLIARAIVHRPRILYFDEATSALDNKTQAMVSESLEQLDATRVVIAHRLSTVRNADLIVVLEGGVVREQGRYDELMAQDGLFAQLARRQIA